MSPLEEKNLLRMVRENNYMLKVILQMMKSQYTESFTSDVLANLLANRIETRNKR